MILGLNNLSIDSRKYTSQTHMSIGVHAKLDRAIRIPGLPKTRSGKVMRRILRKVAEGETKALGDVSTLADSAVVEAIIEAASKV